MTCPPPPDDDESFADIMAMRDAHEPDISKPETEFAGSVERGIQVAQPLGTVMSEGSCTDTAWRKNSVSARALAKLRQARPCAKYDYHGCTREEAHAALNGDLSAALAADHKIIEVVHGCGMGVLRESMRSWLRECVYVVAFAEGCNNPGSVIVQLKQER